MADEEHPARRKELDKDISSYISLLRKKEKKSLLAFLKDLKKKRKKKGVELHPEVEAYGEEKKTEEKPKPKEEAEKEEEELEKEFDEGAKKKTFGQWLKELFVEKPQEQKTPTEEEIMEAVDNAEKEKKKEAEAEMEEELEDQYVEEVQKEGWFSRIIGKIFVKSREEEELEDAADEIAEDQQDMKVIAEISTKVMKMLPAEKLKEFKQSEDFHMFKEILKKRELIK